MKIKLFFLRSPQLFLALRKLKDVVLSGPIRRSPFFRRHVTRLDVRMVNRRGAVCRNPNFIYFRIPKAANSTITLSLQSLINAERIKGDNPPGKAKKLFSPLSSLSADEVEHLRVNFFTFTFVRNPFTRIASAYLSKVVGSERQKVHVTRWYGRGTRDSVTFTEFCEYLQQAKGYLDDAHWARQCDLITLPLNQLDFVGKIENLDQDLRYVAHRLFGLESNFEVVSWQKGTTGAASRSKQLYGEKEMAIVREVYAEDFRAFGYDPDLLL